MGSLGADGLRHVRNAARIATGVASALALRADASRFRHRVRLAAPPVATATCSPIAEMNKVALPMA